MKTQPAQFRKASDPNPPHPGSGLAWLTVLCLLGMGPIARGDALDATYTTGTEVPLTTAGFTATGEDVDLSLEYAPVAGTNLMLVNNTSAEFIAGTFDALPNGETVELTFDGTVYPFVAWYYGGDGNDLVLLWPYTGLAAWGLNLAGQLGDATTRDRRVPIAVDQSGVLAGKTIVQVKRGTSHTLALTTEGRVYGWGDNSDGQLGDSTTQRRVRPVAVNTENGTSVLFGKTVVSIAAGRSHSLALCSDGTIAAWGINSDGRLGDNTAENRLAPVAVIAENGVSALSGKTVVGIAAGRTHSVALCADGTLAAWGGNLFGQVGDNSLANRKAPVAVNTESGTSALSGKTVVAIAAGRYHNLALCSDGTVASWGANEDGRLGDDSTSGRHAPAVVNTNIGSSALFGKSVVGIAAGAFHSLAFCSDGTVASWGANSFGQLGDNTTAQRLVPVPVNRNGVLAGRTVVDVGLGLYHSFARCSDGSLVSWGFNIFGQLGDNSTSNRRVPVAVNTADGTSVLSTRLVNGLACAGAEGGHSLAIYGLEEHVAMPAPEAEIVVEQPAGSPVPNGGGSHLGVTSVDGSTSRQFIIRNVGDADLTGLGTTLGGTDAGSFRIASGPSAPVAGPSGSTSFTVQFAPTSSGLKSATLRIDNNDPDDQPFMIALTGRALSGSEDTDRDGLNDWSEVQMADLGFDWQTAQPDLVNTLFANASSAGLIDESQLEAARQAGQDEVLGDPNGFGLYDQAQFDENLQAGMDAVLNDPNAFGHYTQAQYDAHRQAGREDILGDPNASDLYTLFQFDANRLAGRADILDDPNAAGLYTQEQYDLNRQAGRDDITGDPNAYQLFTFSQIELLTLGAPLLARDPDTGKFTMTIGLEKSSDLTNFAPFPFTAGETSVNAEGKLEFMFTVPDDAAFFKVLGR